jgi:hypothetical protein
MTTLGTTLIASGVAVVVSVVSALITSKQQTARFDHEMRQQRELLQTQHRTELMAEAAIHAMFFENERWPRRSFDAIRERLGGFEDDELRKLLIRSGAVRRESNGKEWWGLRERTP